MKVNSTPTLFEVRILSVHCATVWLVYNLQNVTKSAQKTEIMSRLISSMSLILSCTECYFCLFIQTLFVSCYTHLEAYGNFK